jgi:[protein-PII] uridylyltransferase
VLVTNDASESATMIDVRAPDAIGILYRLASQLSACGLDIRSAKVATLGHEVVDVFYVERPGSDVGLQIPPEDHGVLRDRLKQSLLAE